MEQTIINTYTYVQYLYIESIGQTKYYKKDFHAKRVKPVRFDYEKTSRVYSAIIIYFSCVIIFIMSFAVGTAFQPADAKPYVSFVDFGSSNNTNIK